MFAYMCVAIKDWAVDYAEYNFKRSSQLAWKKKYIILAVLGNYLVWSALGRVLLPWSSPALLQDQQKLQVGLARKQV